MLPLQQTLPQQYFHVVWFTMVHCDLLHVL